MPAEPRLLDRIKEHGPSWALSLVFHVLLLGCLAAITWVVVQTATSADAVLTLPSAVGPEGFGEGPGGANGPDATGGSEGDQEKGEGSSKTVMVESSREALASTVARAIPPAPQALSDLLATVLPEPRGGLLAEAGDPAATLVRALSGRGDSPDPGSKGAGGYDTGVLAGLPGGLGTAVGGMRSSGLDVVLVLDATDSMSPYIDQAKKRLGDIIDVVTGLVPNTRFGMVAYKDYGDDYGPRAVRILRLNADVKYVRTFLDETSAGGGGDIPEPIHEALLAATDIRGEGWLAGRQRVIILVGDSPVHPSGLRVALDVAGRFHARDKGVINVIDVGGSGEAGSRRATVQSDLRNIAAAGGGSAFLLQDQDKFWRFLIVSVFGQRYENDVNTIIDKYVRR